MAKNNLYGTWRVLAPDGELLFLALEKRVNWYLSRNLAEKINDNTIRLTFEPKSRSNSKDNYIITEKLNKCVVCGDETLLKLTKHHIVPAEYRKLFPEILKSRNCHDIVVICRDCHDVYEKTHAKQLRILLEERYNSPLLIVDDIQRSLGVAKILLSYGKFMPKERHDYLINKFSLTSKINKPTIEQITDYISKYTDYKPILHSEIVMKQVFDNNELFEFIKMWRQNFIDTMKPKFMPKYWSIKREL